jgi:hypothetical protein
MGTWGPAIFSDDDAEDIRDDYNTLLIVGKSAEEAEEIIFQEHYDEFKGSDIEPVFWFALALSEWKKGRLSEKVKEKAMAFIDSGEDLARWEEASKADYAKRVKALDDLKEKLLSPMPPAKKVSKPSLLYSPWECGDLLAYRIDKEHVQEFKDWGDRTHIYALLRVVGVEREPFTRLAESEYFYEIPYVVLYEWVGESIPRWEQVKDIPYVTWVTFVNSIAGIQVIIEKKDIRGREIAIIKKDSQFNAAKQNIKLGGTSVGFAGLDRKIIFRIASLNLLQE